MKVFETIETHAEGEPSRVVLDADRWVRGDTAAQRWDFCVRELDWLRHLLLHEPRGAPALCGVLVMQPTNPEADIAMVVLEQGGFTPMSGSNSICTVTALLEEGLLPFDEGPVTRVVIETALGLVIADAHVNAGRVERVTVQNVPAYVVEMGRSREVPEIGTVAVDVAFGGQFFVFADCAD